MQTLPLDATDLSNLYALLDKKVDRAETDRLDLRIQKLEIDLDTNREKILSKVETGDERTMLAVQRLSDQIAKRDANRMNVIFASVLTVLAGSGATVLGYLLQHLIGH